MLLSDAELFLKRLKAQDVEAVVQLFRSVENGVFLRDGRWQTGQLQKVLQQGHSLAMWAAKGLAGAVLVMDNGQALEVIYLATAPWCQRLGVMSRLLEKLQSDALELSRQVWLEVNVGNLPAQRLYKQTGFDVVGRRQNYYPDGGDAYLMSHVGLAKREI